MSMFSGPTEHADNPPETWEVRKAGDRLWEVVTKDGIVITTRATRTHAKQATTEGTYVEQYARDGRWYAGETPTGWKSWEQCRAEQEAVLRRQAERGRSGLAARVEGLTEQLRSMHRDVSPDPVPSDVIAWARWYGATYLGPHGDRLVYIVRQIDAAEAEVARMDALLADYAAA